MKYPGLFILALSLWSGLLSAQSAQRAMSLHYQNEQLDRVLVDISRKYAIRFIYSNDFVAVTQQVSVDVDNAPLQTALDALFLHLPVAYTLVGDNVVLKPEPAGKNERIGLSDPRPVPEPVPLIDTREMEARMLLGALEPIGRQELHELPGGQSLRKMDLEKFRLPTEAEMAAGKKLETYRRLAQVSLLPFVGTNAFRSDEMTNNISLNLLWGANGGVDGVEVGGFFNHITNDVRGIQVAGFGNTVGGTITGTQVSGLFNAGGEEMTGVQVAGVFNVSGTTKAVQIGGLFNVSGDFAGVQVSSLFNVVGGQADGMQIAGLFNTSRGAAKTQISGLFNTAGDVQTGQVSALLNVGKKVNGFQVGLINVADTISGAPVGLLNIIRNGYNRVELSSSEALYANLALKLGAYSFYNIFHFGARWGDPSDTGAEASQQSTTPTWALGYGIGTAIGLGPRSLLNLEVVSLHINEGEEWTRELNQLNQLRLTFDWRAGRRASFFAGPSGNILLSKRRDAEGNLRGSSVAPYTWYESFDGRTSVQMWVGLNAGIRF